MSLTSRMRRGIVGAAIAATAVALPAAALASTAGASSATARSDSATSAARTIAASTAPRCLTRQLTTWLGIPGSGAAGSFYYQLEISNISHRTCTLQGFPGVSAHAAGGRQLGSPARRLSGYRERRVTLRPSQTAHAVLQITDVGNFSPSVCRPVTADSLRVFAPGTYVPMTVPFSFRACARKGPIYLHVSPVQAGAGIPGYSD